jgi:hypothetical protein
MPDFKGIAVQWGISTTTFAAAGTATGILAIITGQEFEKTAKSELLPDRQGETIGAVFFDRGKTLSANLYPSADTIAHLSGLVMVQPGDILTVADSADADISGTFSGKYLVMKANKTKRNDSKVVYAVTVQQFATDIAVAISA